MKKVKRWRYYCDHCKKSGGSAYHIRNHEQSCTKNPDRKCGFCYQAEFDQTKTKDLISLINKSIITVIDNVNNMECISIVFRYGKTEESILKELRDLTENCPACILTAMRLTDTTIMFRSFNWEKEKGCGCYANRR